MVLPVLVSSLPQFTTASLMLLLLTRLLRVCFTVASCRITVNIGNCLYSSASTSSGTSIWPFGFSTNALRSSGVRPAFPSRIKCTNALVISGCVLTVSPSCGRMIRASSSSIRELSFSCNSFISASLLPFSSTFSRSSLTNLFNSSISFIINLSSFSKFCLLIL